MTEPLSSLEMMRESLALLLAMPTTSAEQEMQGVHVASMYALASIAESLAVLAMRPSGDYPE